MRRSLAPAQSLKLKAYEEIKRLIATCTLKPGQPLLEEELAASLSISRTPLRDALNRLAQEGFVEIIPRKGAFVATISITDVSEILLIREALEGIAARLAVGKLSEEALGSLQALYATLEVLRRQGQLDQAGDEIHDRILDAAGIKRMVRALSIYEQQLSWFHAVAFTLPGRLEQSFQEHKVVLAALLARDGEAAEAAMRHHIMSTRRDLESWFSSVPRQ